jgi:hypothetical protein
MHLIAHLYSVRPVELSPRAPSDLKTPSPRWTWEEASSGPFSERSLPGTLTSVIADAPQIQVEDEAAVLALIGSGADVGQKRM